MHQELNNLAKDFERYRGQRKRVKYPQALWDKAINLCNHLSVEKIAKALQVNFFTLQRHLTSGKTTNFNSPAFIPIQIAHLPSIQLHIKSPVPITIDFNGSMEELAKLILGIQGGSPC